MSTTAVAASCGTPAASAIRAAPACTLIAPTLCPTTSCRSRAIRSRCSASRSRRRDSSRASCEASSSPRAAAVTTTSPKGATSETLAGTRHACHAEEHRRYQRSCDRPRAPGAIRVLRWRVAHQLVGHDGQRCRERRREQQGLHGVGDRAEHEDLHREPVPPAQGRARGKPEDRERHPDGDRRRPGAPGADGEHLQQRTQRRQPCSSHRLSVAPGTGEEVLPEEACCVLLQEYRYYARRTPPPCNYLLLADVAQRAAGPAWDP